MGGCASRAGNETSRTAGGRGLRQGSCDLLGEVGASDNEDSKLEGISGDESSLTRFCGRGFMSLLIVVNSGAETGWWEGAIELERSDIPDAADHA